MTQSSCCINRSSLCFHSVRKMSPSVAAAAVFVVLALNSFAVARVTFPKDSQTGAECTLRDGRVSVCKVVKDCPEILALVKKGEVVTKCKSRTSAIEVCCPPPSNLLTASDSQQKEAAAKTKAQDMCAEYAKYAWELRPSVTLSLDNDYDNVSNCAFASDPLILGGMSAIPREFPHMALIGYGSGESFKWSCGGSLISKRHILTAGHCLRIPGGFVPSVVRLGETDLLKVNESAHTDFKIAKIIKHPKYNPPSKYNDLGILELDRDVDFNGTIRPACLYTENKEPKGNATAAGWGRADLQSNEGTNDLLKVGLPFQPVQLCNRTFYREVDADFLKIGIDPRTMICAGAENGKDTCMGDSGGPLQIKDEDHNRCVYNVVGVTSFGQTNCGTEGSPAVYTRVSAFLPWIASIAWE